MVDFGIFDSTIPLHFFLPRGGDRWRKTFRISSQDARLMLNSFAFPFLPELDF
jgi:hypothetical protein